MDERIPSSIGKDGTLWIPSEDLPTELTLVSFQRDLLLMPTIMLSRFPKLERSRPVRLTGAVGNYLKLTADEVSLLATIEVLTVADGGFVHILPNSDRLREAEREAIAFVERALKLEDAIANVGSRSRVEGSLVVISYASQDRAYADLLARHMRVCSINSWHYVPPARFGAMLINPLEEAIRQATAMAVLMSPHSAASQAVNQEVAIAIAKDLCVLPILLGGHPLPMLEHIPYFDAATGELPSENLLRESLNPL